MALLTVVPATLWGRQPSSANGTDSGLSFAKAEALQTKLQEISAPLKSHSNALKSITVTDDEVNSYLKYSGSQFLPKGVTGTRLHIMPGGVYGTAMVNFNQLQIGSGQDDMGSRLISLMFKGTQRVTAFGNLQSGNGKATLKIEDVRIGTTQLSDWLVNWLLQYYVQSKFKIDLSKPLPLPPHVKSIKLKLGRATIDRTASSH